MTSLQRVAQKMFEILVSVSKSVETLEDRRKAHFLSSVLLVFTFAMVALVVLNSLNVVQSSAENILLLNVVTVVYFTQYLLSRTKFFKVAGVTFTICILISCFLAIKNAQRIDNILTVCMFASLVLMVVAQFLSYLSTILVGVLLVVATYFLPEVNPAVQRLQVVNVVMYEMCVIAIVLSWIYVQNEHIGKINNSAKLIQEQQAELIQTSNLAAVGEVAGGIAHEINNPLAVIQGNARRIKKLKERGDTKSIDHSIDVIEKTCERITSITKGMLAMTRVSQEQAWVSIESIYESSLSLCSFSLSGSGVDLETGPNDKIDIFVNPNQISQVFVNIIKNAVDAFDPKSESKKVHVSWEYLDQQATIKISNNGEPIPIHVQKKIMDPFFTTKGVDKGTGLGLSITKKIVDFYGGEIGVSSNQTQTVFTIRLPNAKLSDENQRKKKVV